MGLNTIHFGKPFRCAFDVQQETALRQGYSRLFKLSHNIYMYDQYSPHEPLIRMHRYLVYLIRQLIQLQFHTV